MIVTACAKRPVLEPCTLPEMNYQVDPYIGCEHYCLYCYVLPQAETDWKKEVLFHEDIAGRLASALSGIPPQTIYMGWHTDPYQPCEEQCCQTRQVLEVLLERGFSASLLTKSDLVERDIDLLQSMENASVSVSVAFSDNDVRGLFETNTIDTRARISALRKLKSAGIRTSALLCPVIPHITDVGALIDMLAPCTEKIWVYGLSILNSSDPNWQNIASILKSHFPNARDSIEAAVFDRNHPYWSALRNDLLRLNKKQELNLSVHV